MSFIRPEVTALFHRWFGHWSEPLIILGIGAISLSLLIEGLSRNAAGRIALGLLGLGLTCLLIWSHWRRALMRRETSAPGVVEITERRIAYFSPTIGGVVALDDLTEIDIKTTADGPFAPDVFWVLHHTAGPPLAIPSEATGANGLIDAFTALPGLDFGRVIEAMGSTEANSFVIWRRTIPHRRLS